MARPELGEGISCLVVSPVDMVELEAVKFLLQLSYFLPICSHVGVVIVRLSRDLIDDELRVSTDVMLPNSKFGGNAQTVDQCLILHHIVGGMEV
jgi:hypothetical protein